MLDSDFAFWQMVKPESGHAVHLDYRVHRSRHAEFGRRAASALQLVCRPARRDHLGKPAATPATISESRPPPRHRHFR
jgi:hypothetical protein